MSVPRFDLGPHQMTPSSEGAYVRYEDYATLEAENADLRSRLVPEGLDQGELAERAATWSHEQLLTQYMNAANAAYALTQCLAEERERRHKEQPQ